MSNAAGVIKAVRKDRKGIQMDDGQWYSSYMPVPEHVAVGQNVQFDYQANGTWKNIKGSINVVAGGVPVPTEPAPSLVAAAEKFREPLPEHYQKLDYATLVKSFPVPPTHPDRAIIRQNSLTNAVATMQTLLAVNEKAFEGKDIVSETLNIASQFEKFSTGDLEREAIEAAMTKVPDNAKS